MLKKKIRSSFFKKDRFIRNGFFAILITLFFLCLYSYYVAMIFQQESKASMKIHKDKISQTQILYSVMQQRNLLLSQMIQTHDFFERDHLIQQVHQNGTLFVIAREKLLKLGLSPEEKIIFDKALAQIRKLRPRVNKTADLLMEDRLGEALKIWDYNTYGIHLKAASFYNELRERQNKEAEIRFTLLENNFILKLKLSIYLISIAFLIGLILSVIISRQLKLSSRENRKLNASLEQKVKDRTKSLKKANNQLKIDQEALEKLAHYDTLTNLPNRAYFNERLHQSVASAARQKTSFSILFIDLDRFKAVNDMLGHDIGDQLLIEVSARLKKSIREDDFIARIGGDEFTIIANNTETKRDLKTLANRIIQALTLVFNLSDNQIFIGASIGIAMYPFDAKNIQLLIKKADTAMYHVKESGRNAYSFYDKTMSEKMEKELRFNNALHHAIKNKELVNYYQPIVSITDNHIVSIEILLRWVCSENNTILEAIDFIDLLEKSEKIYEVGYQSLKTACYTFKKIEKETGKLLPLTFNVCARQLIESQFLNQFCQILQETRYPYNFIELDITESLLFENHEAVLKSLLFLRKKGVWIALDGFKIGFPILEHLEKFPIDSIKISRHFFQTSSKTEQNAIIVESIFKLAHSLGINVVAKGVENKKELEYLKTLDCDLYQGNYHCPVAESETLMGYISA